ncbi:hypothetical protein OCU04_012628 [Sclerotinia nivalis]|uniref:Uncharacterized protein n=1 Tax=Sclerotinia nivalis TaxID=352851 RepID=A0A9X0A8Y5_9HELO|nr:hypothetical protein OCU04_012628 [Sclerotinia nivalis]
MASPSQHGFFMLTTPESGGDGLPEWLYLLRGVDAITSPRRDLVLQSPLASLVDME